MYCVSVFDKDPKAATAKVRRASVEADIVELRLDLMNGGDLPALLAAAAAPVLVTYRTVGEGGEGEADWGSISGLLTRAVELGADYVDVEWAMPEPLRGKLLENRRRSHVILSRHLQDRTPGEKKLAGLLEDMAGAGPDVVKIVTTARGIEDNFRVLDLIPKAAETGISIIAFAMGRFGRISRLMCVPMGGLMTFACLEAACPAAPGQLSVRRMRRITEVLIDGN